MEAQIIQVDVGGDVQDVKEVEAEVIDIKVKIDFSALNGEDWITILEVGSLVEAGEKSIPASYLLKYFKMLKRCVVGGLEQIPYDYIPRLAVVFQEQMMLRTNPKDSTGKN